MILMLSCAADTGVLIEMVKHDNPGLQAGKRGHGPIGAGILPVEPKNPHENPSPSDRNDPFFGLES